MISREVTEYLTAAAPIGDHLSNWSDAFNSVWSSDLEPNKQAEALQVLGTRVSQACEAVAQITHLPPEVIGFDFLLREAVSVRHAWVREAVDLLECCETAFSFVTNIGNIETSGIASSLLGEVVTLVQQHDAPPTGSRRYVDAAIGIEITPEQRWLVTLDGLNPELYAPFELNRQGISGLGPDRWQRGAAVRIRRLRNPQPLDAETASSRFVALITQQGSVASVEQVLVSDVPALRHVLSPELADWNATVTVFVSGDFTYFVETGCPSDVARSCDSVEFVAASPKLVP